MDWPYVALWVVLLAAGYAYAWWTFLPRFRERYGDHGRLLLVFFLVAPFAFIAAPAVTARTRKRSSSTSS